MGFRVLTLRDAAESNRLFAAGIYLPHVGGCMSVLSHGVRARTLASLALKPFTCLAASLAAILVFSSSSLAAVTFTETAIKSGDTSSNAIVSGDFNNDGILDLVTVNNSTVSFYQGLGGGKYAAPVNTANAGGLAVAAADFNNDGKLDLAIADFYSGVTIWLGNGNGTFKYLTSMSNPMAVTEKVAIADFNGDHIPDIVMDTCPTHEYGCSVQVYLGHGNGTFTLSSTLQVGNGTAFVAGDFNADGHQDLAVLLIAASGFNGVGVYLGQGNGQFQSPIKFPMPDTLASIAAGDFFNNRIQSMAVVYLIYQGNGSEKAYVETLRYSGGKLVGSAAQNFFTEPDANLGLEIAAGDVTGDFKDDLVVSGAYNQVGSTGHVPVIGYLPGNGNGTFGSMVTLPKSGNLEGSPLVRDLNLDSRHDIGIDWSTDTNSGGGALVLLNTNAPTSCTPPPANKLGVHICAPTSGETVPATFTFKGAGNAFDGIAKRMELWIDGKKVGQMLLDQLSVTATLAAGKHTASFVVVDSFDHHTSQSVSFSAQ